MKCMKISKSPGGHEVLCEQYLHAFLDISDTYTHKMLCKVSYNHGSVKKYMYYS